MKNLSKNDIEKVLFSMNGLLCWQDAVTREIASPLFDGERSDRLMGFFNQEVDKISAILGVDADKFLVKYRDSITKVEYGKM